MALSSWPACNVQIASLDHPNDIGLKLIQETKKTHWGYGT